MQQCHLYSPFGLLKSSFIHRHRIFDKTQLSEWRAMRKEADLLLDASKKEVEHTLVRGLLATDSLEDQEARKRNATILAMNDVVEPGLGKVATIALETTWDSVDAVYISFDMDAVDRAFVPGTGWLEPGDFLSRAILYLQGALAQEGICGIEVLEVSAPCAKAVP
jgi:arginase family enzyme